MLPDPEALELKELGFDVLILVVMEDAPRLHGMSTMDNLIFVLILVVMEDAPRLYFL